MSTATSTESLVQALVTQTEDVVDVILAALDEDQLRQLVLELAGRLRVPQQERSPAEICAEATRLAAQAFGTVPELLVAKNRQQVITDARAAAQAAARSCKLTLPAIADYFGQHHASVMHAIAKVEASPELSAIAERITAQLLEVAPAVPGRAA